MFGRRRGGEKVEKEWFYNEEPVAPACVSLLSQLEEEKKIFAISSSVMAENGIISSFSFSTSFR